MNVIPLRRDHEQLGRLAADALEQGRTELAFVHLAQIYLDTAPDREAARPIADRIKELGKQGGRDGAA